MWRLATVLSLFLAAGFLASLAGLTAGTLLATLGIGLLTVLFFVPAVFLCELLSRRTDAGGPQPKGPVL